MSKDWERHGLCCEQLWETGECDCEARDVMRLTAGLPKRAPYTLSERMRDECVSEGMAYIDEVAALELTVANLTLASEEARKTIDRQATLIPQEANNSAELSPVDKLNQGYERAGLSSALVVNNKYGKHSAFGYMGRE